MALRALGWMAGRGRGLIRPDYKAKFPRVSSEARGTFPVPWRLITGSHCFAGFPGSIEPIRARIPQAHNQGVKTMAKSNSIISATSFAPVVATVRACEQVCADERKLMAAHQREYNVSKITAYANVIAFLAGLPALSKKVKTQFTDALIGAGVSGPNAKRYRENSLGALRSMKGLREAADKGAESVLKFFNEREISSEAALKKAAFGAVDPIAELAKKVAALSPEDFKRFEEELPRAREAHAKAQAEAAAKSEESQSEAQAMRRAKAKIAAELKKNKAPAKGQKVQKTAGTPKAVTPAPQAPAGEVANVA